MEWMKIEDVPIDYNKIHFLLDGDSIYMRGTELQPFFIQLCGEMKTFPQMNWTHWTCLPDIPNL